ncbi:MAG: PqqD family protein [Prevotella sp.]|nr:PqqD family protein [Prevotella sp.]
MKLKKGFVLRNVCGEHVVVAEGTGLVNFNKLISLNESAAFLWEQAEQAGDFTAETLCKALTEAYDVTEEQAQKDIEQTLQEWRRIGLTTD